MMNTQNNIQTYPPTFYNRFMSEEVQDQNPIDKSNVAKLPFNLISMILKNVGVHTQRSAFLLNKHWYCSQLDCSSDMIKRLSKDVEVYLQRNNIQYDKLHEEDLLCNIIEPKKYYKDHVVSLLRKANIIDMELDIYIPDICNRFYIMDLYTQFLLEKENQVKFNILVLLCFLLETDQKNYKNIKILVENRGMFFYIPKTQSLIKNILYNIVFPRCIENKDKKKFLLNCNRDWSRFFFQYCIKENISDKKIIQAIIDNPHFGMSIDHSFDEIFSLWLENRNELVKNIQKISKDPDTKDSIRYFISKMYIQSSRFQLAVKEIDNIKSPFIKNLCLKLLVKAYTEHKMYDNAEKIFEKIEERINRLALVYDIGTSLPNIGTIINDKIDPDLRDDAWKGIVGKYAQVDKYAEAEEVIEKISNSIERDRGWNLIVQRYAQVDKYAEAEKAIEKISNSIERDRGWNLIVQRYAQVDKYAEAEKAIEKISSSIERDRGWNLIVQRYAQVDRYAEAEKAIEKISSSIERDRGWNLIVQRYAQVDRYAEAEKAIEKISNSVGQDSAWELIIKAYIKAGQYEKAKISIGKTTNVIDRDKSWKSVIEEYVKSRKYSEAEIGIKELSSSESKKEHAYNIVADCIRNGITNDLVKSLMTTYFSDDKNLNLAFKVQFYKKNNRNFSIDNFNIDKIKDFVKKKTDYLFK